jgi:thiosulfate dehydrogenase [quinone] large subunit
MTRNRTYALTGLSAALYLALCTVFADGMFNLSGGVFSKTNAKDGITVIADGTIWTYVFLALIVAAGISQARRLPADGVVTNPATDTTTPGQVDDPVSWKLLMGNTFWAIVWLPVRFFVGRDWLAAGEHKVRSDAWMKGGTALKGFWLSALGKTDPATTPKISADYGWFSRFLDSMVRHEWYTWFAKVIAVGEVLVGIGLIVGALVGIAAFFGTFMNFNFQLAGSASSNPVLFGLGVFLVLAWKVAGYYGLDRYLLPALGTPWTRLRLLTSRPATGAQPPRAVPAA